MKRSGSGSKHVDPGLDDAFRYADSTRNQVEAAKKLARKHPIETAVGILEDIPTNMQHLREQAAALYGVDIADPEKALKAYKARDHVDTMDFLHKLNMYSKYEELQGKLHQYTRDPELSREELAAKICEVGIEAMNAIDEVYLHMLNEQRHFVDSRGSTEAAKMAKNEEARRMAAHLATRTSAHRNRSLAKALDKIRGYNGPGRLKTLLRELYVEGPQAWDEQSNAGQRLLSTRTAAAKKIVERLRTETSSEAELAAFADREAALKRAREAELATFAEREAALKQAREAGLPPREYELFGLVVSDPKRFLRNGKLNHNEAAQEMGVAVGTIKSLWSRTRKTLTAS
jgi:hypothetical protein